MCGGGGAGRVSLDGCGCEFLLQRPKIACIMTLEVGQSSDLKKKVITDKQIKSKASSVCSQKEF